MLRPAFSAASMPAMTWAKSPQRVMALKRSGRRVSSEMLMRSDAGVLQLLCELRELAAVGGQRQLVEPAAEVARKRAKQPQDILAHQRLATGDPQFTHALGNECRAQPVELLEREQVLLRQEGHVLRHAVGAAKIAAVGDGDPQIGHVPAKRVDHRRLPHEVVRCLRSSPRSTRVSPPATRRGSSRPAFHTDNHDMIADQPPVKNHEIARVAAEQHRGLAP